MSTKTHCPNCGSSDNKEAKIEGRKCGKCDFSWSPDEIKYLREDIPNRLVLVVYDPETKETLWSTYSDTKLSMKAFELLVEKHWDRLIELVPEKIRGNIGYVVKEEISEKIKKELNPGELKQDMFFGSFQGAPQKHGVIFIYKKPIERFNFFRHELIDRHTFLVLKHELQHFLGMKHK